MNEWVSMCSYCWCEERPWCIAAVEWVGVWVPKVTRNKKNRSWTVQDCMWDTNPSATDHVSSIYIYGADCLRDPFFIRILWFILALTVSALKPNNVSVFRYVTVVKASAYQISSYEKSLIKNTESVLLVLCSMWD